MASNRKRSRGRIKAYDMGQDSVGDRVGVELLFNSVEFGVPEQLPVEFQRVRDQMC